MGKMKFRSVEAQEKRQRKQQEYLLAHSITLDYSFYEPICADKIFTVASKEIIRVKLREAFNGEEPMHALNHEYGEVLNHFGA